MSSTRHRVHRTMLLAVALAASATVAHAQGMKMGKAQWSPGPPFLPPGAKMMVESGNPGAAGPFTLLLALPNKYTVPPHWHPTDEHVTVKSGTFLYGMGDTMDRAGMKSLKKGQDVNLVAKMHHSAMARGRTVIEIQSTGPFAITYLNAADDPRGKPGTK